MHNNKKNRAFNKNLSALLCMILITSNNHIVAQEKDVLSSENGISISYFGAPTKNYGVQALYEIYPIQTNKYKSIVSSSLLFINNPQTFTSYGISVNWGVRRTFKFGLFLNYSFKTGYLGRFYQSDIFLKKNDGEIANFKHRLFNTFLFGNSFGLGYDFSLKSKLDIQLFVNPIIYYRFPNHNNILIKNNLAIEAGITFHPKFHK